MINPTARDCAGAHRRRGSLRRRGNTETVADAVPVLGGCVIEAPNDVPGVGRTAACPTILSTAVDRVDNRAVDGLGASGPPPVGALRG